MKIAGTIARYLLGFVFLVMGLNGFLQFMPPPPPAMIPSDANVWTQLFFRTHYIWFTSGVQVLSALLLLTNQYVRLAMIVLGGMLANILAFHILMWPQALPLALVALLLWLIVGWSIRESFGPLFARTIDS